MFREYHCFSFILMIFVGSIAVGFSKYSFLFPNQEITSQKPIVQQLTGPVYHGEGPHWDAEKQLLFFVDIMGQRIYQYDPCSKRVTFADIGAPVGAVIPLSGTTNKFVVGKKTTLSVVTWNGENSTSKIPIDEIDYIESNKPLNRFNDGKCDRAGRLWIGTMGNEDDNGVEPKQGTLYRLSDSCKLEARIRNVTISNGLAWSPDNLTMYYIDTETSRVDKLFYNVTTGDIIDGSRQKVIDFREQNIAGSPDGMTIDNKGNLWIACWNGSKVINVDTKTGKVIYEIPLPVERVTSVAFGGKNFDILYITTMKKGLTAEQLKQQPAAGALFSVTNLPVKGFYNSPVQNLPCLRSRGH
ncbi:regucalcin-like [Planococcus citri]|uniref:regucalcin-like n=1 Tax=Planococcus citri TaxID=170843 RepID=UPI0031FA20D4